MNIAYVGPFSFPSSNANSLRVKGMAEALAMAGHEVQICASVPVEKGTGDIVLPEGVNFHYVNEYETGLFSGLNRGLRGLFLGDITLRWLETQQRKPDVVVLYGTHLGYLLRMLGFCKKYKIPLLLDVVEWYDPRHLPGGVFGPFSIANELSMRLVAKKANGMFTISRYLEEHFYKQGCRTLRVPPLFSFPQVRPQQFRASNQMLNLCYAGSPGKKEDMESLFMGLQMAYDAGVRFTMHIVGITANEFALAFGMQSLPILAIENVVKFYGRLENTEARRIIASSDFMALLRKNLRVAKAGFPSKVAESIYLGTPVMTNLSSNLDEYLADHNNSIIVKEADENALFDAIVSAGRLSKYEIEIMKNKTRHTGDNKFSLEENYETISKFVESFGK